MQELRDFQFNLMYHLKVLYIVIENPQPQMTFYEQAHGNTGKEKHPFNLPQNPAQGQTVISHSWLGVRRKTEIIISNDLMHQMIGLLSETGKWHKNWYENLEQGFMSLNLKSLIQSLITMLMYKLLFNTQC